MDSTHSASASLRLAALERAHGRLRTAFLGLAVGCGALLWMGASSGPGHRDDVDAGRFTLVAADGRACARLELDANGLPRLVLLDLEGRQRAVLGIGTEDVSLSLRGVDGQPRLGLALDGTDQPHVVLADARHRPRMHLSVNAKGYGNLVLRADDGTIAAGVGLQDDAEPWIRPLRQDAAGSGKR
jgi:hypothetical protein